MNENPVPHRQSDSGPQISRVTRLLRRCQASLNGINGRAPKYREIEEWTDVAESTIKDWLGGKGKPSGEFLIQLLERLPPRLRHEIVDGACRVFPSLKDPRVRCDQTTASMLRTIVCRTSGLTFVKGESDEDRTFLISALANEFLSATQPPRRAVGIDVHRADWFVPVPGVSYLDNTVPTTSQATVVQMAVSQIASGRMQLVLLNGVWSAVPDLHDELRALAARNAVIVADCFIDQPATRRRSDRTTVNVLSISKHSAGGDAIQVEITAL